MIDFIPIICAYLLGGIPFGIFVCRISGRGDIRQLGSGNIGATNVARVCGYKYAIWVYVGDIGKGVVAVLLAKWFASVYTLTLFAPDILFVSTAIACVIGSVFPLYLKFKGGKGVNAALGSVITLMFYESLLAFFVFLVIALLSRYISLGSIVGTVSLFFIILIEKYILHQPVEVVYVYLTLLFAILIPVTHLKNIKRMLAGTESKIKFSSQKREMNDIV